METKGRKMSEYNEEYYLIFERYNDETLYLTNHDRSSYRNYRYTKLDFGEPMFFENAFKEEDLARGINRPINKAHLSNTYPVISNDIKEALGDIENNYFQFYPAVIIANDNNYVDNYWLFNVHSKIDVLDLDSCIIKKYDPSKKTQKIKKYYLSDEKLSEISLKDRLVLKPKHSNINHIIVHQSVVDVFNSFNVDTLRFIKVSEWQKGMQFVD